MIRPTPAIVTQLAARRLPRWVLILMGVLYVVPGFLGRDPWRNDDLAAFGVMLELATGRSDWWQPSLLGEPAITAGWLPYWLGAWSIQLFGFLPADLAAKLPFAALLLLTMASTWYAVLHLARLPSAQPVAFAFGGQAHPVDYARATADAALLALVASLGVVMLVHETTVDAARLAFLTLAFHATARTLSPYVRSHVKTVTLWWIAAFGLAWSGVPGLALAVGLLGWVPLLNSWLSQARLLPNAKALPLGVLSAGLAGSVLAVASALWAGAAWHPHSWVLADWLNLDSWQRWGRLLLWFTWPTGLLALWSVWTWRKHWYCAHWFVPVLWASVLGLLAWLDGGRDRTLLLAMPMLAALAAFSLPTLRRSASAWLDWFSVLFFTGGAIIIWVIWIATMTGTPAEPAANVAKLMPLFTPSWQPVLLVPALMITVGWLAVIVWRVGRHRPALWKTLVLSASGFTLCWVLLMTLWLPMLNHGMGQASISERVARQIPPGQCVVVHGLSHAQIAGLLYHTPLELHRHHPTGALECDWLVTVVRTRLPSPPSGLDDAQWQLVERIPRLRENREMWLIYQRVQ